MRLLTTSLIFCAAYGMASGCSGTANDERVFALIESVSPERGPLAGGNTVTITGAGFIEDEAAPNNILVGSILADRVSIVDANTIEVEVPPGVEPGPVTITLFNGNGSFTTEEIYSYNPLPTVTAIDPEVVDNDGGDTITVTGSGFEELEAGENRFFIGGVEATIASVDSDTELTVETPPGVPPAFLDVSLENANGEAVLEDALRYDSDGLLTFGHGSFNSPPGQPFEGEVDSLVAGGGETLHLDSDTLLLGTAFPPITTSEGAQVRINYATTDGEILLYATRDAGLFKRDLTTGEVEALGSVANCGNRVHAMAFHQGELFAFCRNSGIPNGNFGTIDLEAMTYTPRGSNSDCCNMNLTSDGTTLFAGIENRYGVMDPQNGVFTENFTINGRTRGMAFADGELWMMVRGLAGGGGGNVYGLHTVDPQTGERQLQSSPGLEFHGLVPLP